MFQEPKRGPWRLLHLTLSLGDPLLPGPHSHLINSGKKEGAEKMVESSWGGMAGWEGVFPYAIAPTAGKGSLSPQASGVYLLACSRGSSGYSGFGLASRAITIASHFFLSTLGACHKSSTAEREDPSDHAHEGSSHYSFSPTLFFLSLERYLSSSVWLSAFDPLEY